MAACNRHRSSRKAVQFIVKFATEEEKSQCLLRINSWTSDAVTVLLTNAEGFCGQDEGSSASLMNSENRTRPAYFRAITTPVSTQVPHPNQFVDADCIGRSLLYRGHVERAITCTDAVLDPGDPGSSPEEGLVVVEAVPRLHLLETARRDDSSCPV